MEDIRTPLTEGATIGRYRVVEVIGRGASSLCYEVVSDSGGWAVLKEVYPLELAACLERNEKTQAIEPAKWLDLHARESTLKELRIYRGRQKREMDILTSLRSPGTENNPYVFPPENLTDEGSGVYCIATGTEGGTMLSQLMDDRKPDGRVSVLETAEQVFNMTRRILEAVAPVHSKEIIHCDISPDNLFVSDLKQDDDPGRHTVRLIDFNSAFFKNEKRENLIFSTKRAYSSLELMDPKRFGDITYGSDLYSVAAILFEMLFNKVFNYERHTGTGHETKLTIHESEYLKHICPKARNLLHKILSKALIDRYASVDDFKTDLDELIRLSGSETLFLTNFRVSTPDEKAIGREAEKATLYEILQKSNIAYIRGPGGLGKSELAKIYVADFRGEYETVMFLNYSGSLGQTIADMPVVNFDKNMYSTEKEAEQLGVDRSRTFGDNNPRSTRSRKEPAKYNEEIYRKKLEVLLAQDARTLIVIDNFNVDHDENLDKLQGTNCRFLFTTRNSQNNADEITVTLDKLAPDTALELFRRHWGDETLDPVEGGAGCNSTAGLWHCGDETLDPVEVKSLLESIGYNTLVLILAAKSMKRNDITLDELSTAIKQCNLKSIPGNVRCEIDYADETDERTVIEHLRVVFNLSFLTKGEKYIMTNMALVPPEGIIRKDFREWSGSNINDINHLIDSGWIQENEKVISLHPIVSILSNEDLKPDNIKCKRYISNIYQEIQAEEFKKPRLSYLCGLSFPVVCEIEEVYKVFPDFSRRVGIGFYTLEDYKKALLCFKKNAAVSIKLFGKESSETAISFHNLAVTYFMYKDYNNAIMWFKKLLAIKKKLPNIKSEEIGQIYKYLAASNHEIGNYRDAVKWSLTALTVYEKISGGVEDSVCAEIYHTIAQSYEESAEHIKAREWFYKTIEIRQKVFGPEDSDIFGIYNEIMATYMNEGDREYSKIAFDSIIKKFNLERLPDTDRKAEFFENIAIFCMKADEYKSAVELMQTALAIREKGPGLENDDAANLFAMLGLAFASLDNKEMAREYCNKAVANIENSPFYLESIFLAGIYKDIGQTYALLNDYKNALQWLHQAAAINEKLLGLYHRDTATAHYLIALVYYIKKDYEKALKWFHTTLEIKEKLLGCDNEEVMDIYGKIAQSQYDNGNIQMAHEWYRKALIIGGKLYRNEADKCNESGDLVKSLEYYLRASKIFEDILGEIHIDTKAVYRSISVIYQKMGDSMKSEEYHDKTVQNDEKI